MLAAPLYTVYYVDWYAPSAQLPIVYLVPRSAYPENRNTLLKPIPTFTSSAKRPTILTEYAACICLYFLPLPPHEERITLAPWAFYAALRYILFLTMHVCCGRTGGRETTNTAVESVGRLICRQRKGLHWLLFWFPFSVCIPPGRLWWRQQSCPPWWPLRSGSRDNQLTRKHSARSLFFQLNIAIALFNNFTSK